MNISRRFFLGGALSVAAAAAVPHLPAVAQPYPVLYGDGIHDDTDALQALLSGKPVICEGTLINHVEGAPIFLRHGSYRISSTIEVSRGYTHIDGVALIADGGFKGDCMLRVQHSAFGSSMRNTFLSGPVSGAAFPAISVAA